MTLDQILSGSVPLDADACEQIRQFARDYDWGDSACAVEFAADAAVADLTAELATECVAARMLLLRGALIASAERHNERILSRAEEAAGVAGLVGPFDCDAARCGSRVVKGAPPR